MAILVNADTKVICQGITGAFGALHTRGCLHYGTQLVGGVTPGKGGTKDDNGLPIFDTVEAAARATGATATMIFVPPAFAADAILEAADAGLSVICCITEGVPVQDMVKVRAALDLRGSSSGAPGASHSITPSLHPSTTPSPQRPAPTLIGPNCPGIITPGRNTGSGQSATDTYTSKAKGGGGCKIGIMPGYIHTHIADSK